MTKEFWEIVGVFLAVQGLGITVIAFLMKQTRDQIQDLRREMNEKFGSCQKLCGNEMRHLTENIVKLERQVDEIWDEMFEHTLNGSVRRKNG